MPADRVLLWRHGRTAYNDQRRFQGQSDVPMDAVGADQAAAAAAVLARGLDGDVVRVVSSDLSRATATAEPLARLLRVEVVLDARLREVDAGEWEGLTRAEIAASWPVGLQAWAGGEDVPTGGAERRSEASARAAQSIWEHAESVPSGTLVVVSHGGCLRGAVLRLIGVDAVEAVVLGGLGNARWAELRPGVPGWRLLAYNVGVELEPPGRGGVDSPSRDAGAEAR